MWAGLLIAAILLGADRGGEAEDLAIGQVVMARAALEVANDRLNESICGIGLVRRADLNRAQLIAADGSADYFEEAKTRDGTLSIVANPYYAVRRKVTVHATPAPVAGGPARIELEWLDRFSDSPHRLAWRANAKNRKAVIERNGREIFGDFHLALYHRVQVDVSYEGDATIVRVFNGPDLRVLTVDSGPIRVSRRVRPEQAWEGTVVLPLVDGTMVILAPGARPDVAVATNGEDRYFLAHLGEWLGRYDGVRRNDDARWQRELILDFRRFEEADDKDHPASYAVRLEATRRLRSRADELHTAIILAQAQQIQLRVSEALALLTLRSCRQRSHLKRELEEALKEALLPSDPAPLHPTVEATP